MTVPTNAFMWIMACLPILVLLVLMIRFGWGATEAAPIGLIITIITSVCFYKADLKLLASESAKGVWSAMPILLIVWTAILLYQVGSEARAFTVIRDGMRRLLPNELLLVIAMGWILESFLQGITGFGVPVAVGAPLLIGIGVQPLWAVVIPLIGQAWGNTFGTLAAAWDSLAMSAGLEAGSSAYLLTAFWTALFIWIWNITGGVAVCWFYGKKEAVRKGFAAVIVLAVIQGGGELLLSQVNTTLCCFIPAVVSLGAVLLLGRLGCYRDSWEITDSPIMDRRQDNAAFKGEGSRAESAAGGMTLLQAFIPYFILSFLTLAVLLITPVYNLLGQFTIGFAFPETATGYGYVNAASARFSPFAPLTHASMFLLVSALAGLIYYRGCGFIADGGTKRVFVKSLTMTAPSGIAVVGLVMLSKLMDGTGQTQVLANGIAGVLGRAYLVFAPFIGLLGTFMTGSNMSSNILFGGFQVTTAGLLGVEAPSILGAQSAGGAIGSMVSPSKIILGTTTAGIRGSEGSVMKILLAISVPVVIVIGVITLLIAW